MRQPPDLPIRVGAYVLSPDPAEGSCLVFAADGSLVGSLTRDEIERATPKRTGPGHPADPSRDLANDADLFYAGGEAQLLDRMDERNLRRRVNEAAKRELIDRKTRKLTTKGWALVTRYHVVGNPLTPDPRRVPQDVLGLGPVESAVVAEFDARGRPLNAAARRFARAAGKVRKTGPARCGIEHRGEMCVECRRLVTAWAICPLTGAASTLVVPMPAKTLRRKLRRRTTRP